MADGAAPEVGRDHIFTNVHLRLYFGSSEDGEAAAVDEDRLGVGKRQQQAVALAYVDERDFKFALRDMGREGLPVQQDEEHGYGEDGCVTRNASGVHQEGRG